MLVTYLFENLRSGARINKESNFEFWGRARNIGVWTGKYLWRNLYADPYAAFKVDFFWDGGLVYFYALTMAPESQGAL
jgi:hypothetical protein